MLRSDDHCLTQQMAGEIFSTALAGAAATIAFGPIIACTKKRQFLPYDDISNFVEVDGWRTGNWRDRVLWATSATRGFVYEPLSWVLKGAQVDVFGMSPTHFAAVSALVTSAAVSATAQVPTVIYIGYVRTGIAGGPGRRARPAGAEAPRRRRRQ